MGETILILQLVKALLELAGKMAELVATASMSGSTCQHEKLKRRKH